MLKYMQAQFAYSLELLTLGFLLFIPLALLFPSNRSQPLFHRGVATNLGFLFFLGPVYEPAQTFFQVFLFAGLYSAIAKVFPHNPATSLASLPLWVQVLLMLVATDFLQYWTHRLSHGKTLWRFHAIHHSSKEVDWTSGFRWHPLNTLFHMTLTQAAVWSLGFSPAALGYAVLISVFNGMLVHANVNWTYGPLRYVIASPVFHRWHHTSPAEGGEKNFAPFLSVFDVIFGTFYMPSRTPAGFGTPYDAVPDHLWGQLLYPFRKSRPVAPSLETSG